MNAAAGMKTPANAAGENRGGADAPVVRLETPLIGDSGTVVCRGGTGLREVQYEAARQPCWA